MRARAASSEEFLVSAELPDGHDKNVAAILARLARLVAALRARWPGVKIIFRADAWFATPGIFDWCEENGLPMAGREARHLYGLVCGRE